MTTTYPSWIHDDTAIDDPFGYGERAVNVIRKHFKHPKTGRPFELSYWMERVVRRIYGPCHPDGRRIVKNAILMLPRGSRKTTLGAALALLHTVGPEKVNGGQVICCAYDREQSRIAYEEAAGIVRVSGKMASRVKMLDSRHRFTNKATRTRLQAVSSDANARNGATPSFVLFDEVHCWRDRSLYDVLRTGLGKTSNTLSIVISQAGRGQENLAYEIFSYARKVARGEVEDPGTLPVLLETDPEADWQDEANWHRVNPGLAQGYPDLDALRQEAREAANRPALREKFRNDHLNIWLDRSTDPFVDMNVYDRGDALIDFTKRKGRPAWLGVDVSATTDLTAVVACLPDDDGGYTVQPHFFVPGDRLYERADRDGVPYPQWAADGFITPTDGNVIDYAAVERRIRELCQFFEVRQIGFDKAYAQPIMAPLIENRFPVVTVQQGWFTQSPALGKLERAIVSGKFRHGGHPVLRWCFDNVAIRPDTNGNRTINKSGSTDRVDGATAAWMALELASVGIDQRNVYASGKRPNGFRIF